jgi:hypothetical protein
MSNNNSPANGALHLVVGAIAAGVSHALVPVRNWFDYIVRTMVGAFLSAIAFTALRAA